MSEKRTELVEKNTETTVDVLIPVYKPGKTFLELLRRLLVQTYPIQRIIIMNTERKYWNEAEIAPLFAESDTRWSVFHLTKPEFDHGRTRHQGMMESDAEICLCMTQDAVPQNRRLVEHLVEALESCPDAAVAYGRQLPASDCGVIERFTRAFNYPPESRVKTRNDLDELGIKTFFCSNVCAAYRRSRYLELGGFIKRTIFNEDMIFAGTAVQAGYAIVYAADACVVHSHNYTALEQLHRNFDLAVSQADHPEIFSGIPSEGEGIRLVKKTAACLVSTGHWYLLPRLVSQSGMKYLGYRLGRNYRRLPMWLVRKLSMNRVYWQQPIQ